MKVGKKKKKGKVALQVETHFRTVGAVYCHWHANIASPSSQDFIFIYICTSIFILIVIYAISASLSRDLIFKFTINIILTYIFAYIGAKSVSKSNHTMFNFVK